MDKGWQNRFSLSEADYNEWKNSDQKDSFAVYLLKANKIHIDQYREWALDCYQIPFLEDSFFQNLSFFKQLWDQVKYRSQWNENLMPLYEWDNILFVACLQLPEKQLEKNMVPLLVSPKNIKFLWNKTKTFATPLNIESEKKDPSRDLTLAPPQENPQAGLFAKSSTLLNTFVTTTIGLKQAPIPKNEVFSHIFKQSDQYFEGAIIFSFQNKEFQPLEWSDSMEGPATPIKTDKPSIFRMIVRSRSPYHGFIIDNEQHKKFFEPWGFKQLPKHVTLIPIFNSAKNIIGAFMGIANQNLPAKTLYVITKWTTPLSNTLNEASKQNKKSA